MAPLLKKMKEEILGNDYSLELSIVDEIEIRNLNLQYRNIDKPTDILSFPLDNISGQIFICPSETLKESEKFNRNYDNFFLFLFIHGLVHLKGYDHGSKMESIEKNYREMFGV